MITISRGPAIRSSLDAPILFMESYHVKIPIASAIDARTSSLVDFVNRFVMALFFLKPKTAVSIRKKPAAVILVAENTSGEILIDDVKYSIIMDSTESAIAKTKTIQDFRINKAEFKCR